MCLGDVKIIGKLADCCRGRLAYFKSLQLCFVGHEIVVLVRQASHGSLGTCSCCHGLANASVLRGRMWPIGQNCDGRWFPKRVQVNLRSASNISWAGGSSSASLRGHPGSAGVGAHLSISTRYLACCSFVLGHTIDALSSFHLGLLLETNVYALMTTSCSRLSSQLTVLFFLCLIAQRSCDPMFHIILHISSATHIKCV